MAHVESRDFYLVQARDGRATLLLVDAILDDATHRLEWSVRPILGGGTTHRAIIDLTNAHSCETGISDLFRFLGAHLSPSEPATP